MGSAQKKPCGLYTNPSPVLFHCHASLLLSPPLYVIPQELTINWAILAKLTPSSRNPEVKPVRLLGSCMHRRICWCVTQAHMRWRLSECNFSFTLLSCKNCSCHIWVYQTISNQGYLRHCQGCGVESFNMKISVKWQPWLKQWSWRNCVH